MHEQQAAEPTAVDAATTIGLPSFGEVKCTPDQAERGNHLINQIGAAGFEIVPLPVVQPTFRFQLQRGDRIYDRFEVSHVATMVNKPAIEHYLDMLGRFALTAEAHPRDDS